jgi:deoxyribonuclease-4
LNDSKKPLGSRVDRHEHIGRGEIGLDAFKYLFQDPKFSNLPGYLETEKGTDEESGEDWDVINLRTLRGLV